LIFFLFFFLYFVVIKGLSNSAMQIKAWWFQGYSC
jgi:hypothetical protein